MESKKEIIESLKLQINILESKNKKLSSEIESNKKLIQEFQSYINKYSDNNFTPDEPLPITQENPEDKIVNLKFGWKINDNARIIDNSKTVKKVSGGSKWNCSAIGDKTLINGKINKWKLQLTKYTGGIVFGIVPKYINIGVNAIDNWTLGYVTCSSNFAKHNLGVWTEFAKHQAKQRNIVEVFVDLEKGELSFSVNGKNFGIFCQNIMKDIEYVPFLDINNEESEVTLIQ